jgi:hypothetical protein
MISRDTSEYRIPGVPIEMPSETLIVLKITPLAPASSAPLAASSARPSMCMLGDTNLWALEIIL